MLKKLTNNKKGFTLVEILVAVTILGIIVGPLLISLFSNNRIIEQARKETEATYVAKKVMEETLADYYGSISGTLTDTTDGMGFPVYIGKLVALLGKNSTNNSYTSTDGYKSRYADKFTYDIKIVPSGKNGLGTSNGVTEMDSSANYLHIYTDKVMGMEYCYAVAPDGTVKRLPSTMNTYSTNTFNVTSNGSTCNMTINGSSVFSNATLNTSKNDFRIVCYSSNDSASYNFNFDAGRSWPVDCDRFLNNYTSRSDDTKVSVTTDEDFISSDNVENYYSSSREQWDIVLYEITVSVYEEGSDIPLVSVESVIEVKIFAKTATAG